jgi:hypothetical protein
LLVLVVRPPFGTFGVGQLRVAPVSESVAPGWLPQLSESSARAVGQLRVASVNVVPGCITPVVVVCRAALAASVVWAVGHNENSFS